MRIQSLKLENFRSFRNEEIDLSGDLVAIYGRNGVGKTAIFDAIEFAFLGSIGRFNGNATFQHLTNVFSSDAAKVRLALDSEVLNWIEVTAANNGVMIATGNA